MKAFQIFTLPWSDFAPVVSKVIPPLVHSEHKGGMGRIGVLGGSKDYTGAPFYAADAALKFGCDLSTVLCSQQAAIPIKCYSPELMVTPFYHDEHLEYVNISSTLENNENPPIFKGEYNPRVDNIKSEITRAESIIAELLPRFHALVIGPGLGRNEHVGQIVYTAIALARQQNIHLVVDADGLWFLNQNHMSIYGYTRCIITPNAAEFARLKESISRDIQSRKLKSDLELERISFYQSLIHELESSDDNISTRALSLALGGVTVLRKAEYDIVTSGEDVFVLQEMGSPRRCGGQGDILAGCTATAMHWTRKTLTDWAIFKNLLTNFSSSQKYSEIDLVTACEWDCVVQPGTKVVLSKAMVSHTGILTTAPSVVSTSAGRERLGNILAGLLASVVLKRASRLSFVDKKRSMTAPDVLSHIGPAFESLFEQSGR